MNDLAPILAALAEAVDKVKAEEYRLGFSAGVHAMKRFGERPKGTHGLACGGSLVWDGDPIPCGCRPCKCVKCGEVLVSPSTACEYAGLDCNPPSASETLKGATLTSR